MEKKSGVGIGIEPGTESQDAISLVTWNVLSPELTTPSFHPGCDTLHLQTEYRFKQITAKLTRYIESKSIVCLQEVNDEWYDRLSTFFEDHQYVCFGRPTQRVGSLIAHPHHVYKCVRRETKCVTSEIAKQNSEVNKRKQKNRAELFRRVRGYCITKCIAFVLWCLSFLYQTPRVWRLQKKVRMYGNSDPWVRASQPGHLMILSAEFQTLNGQKSFCVATYHAPCEFLDQPLMSINLGMASRIAQAFALHRPLIFCGDFNTKPSESNYRMLTADGFRDPRFGAHVAPIASVFATKKAHYQLHNQFQRVH